MTMNGIIKNGETVAQNLEECIDTLLTEINGQELDIAYFKAIRLVRTLRVYARRRVALLNNKEDNHGKT